MAALNNKDIDRLFLYGCNAGHLDYQGTNPASQFSQKVNGAPVLASDGTVFSHEKRKLIAVMPAIIISEYMQYESRGDGTFTSLLVNGTRDNQGWFVYTTENGVLNVSNSHGEFLDISGMISATGGIEPILRKIFMLWVKENQIYEVNA